MIVMAKNKSDQKRRIENVLSALKHDKLAIASLVFLIAIIALALLAPILPLDPNTTDVRNMFQPPSPEHWFGTDDIGRDYLSRVIYGGRVSLLVGFLAMITCVCVGVLVGTVSGYCGGWIDSILMRIVDIMSSIPWMVLVTVISLFLKRGLKSIIIVIGFFTWMEIARLVRAETLSLKEREYVMYAKFVGIPGYVIILKHIIPSVLPTIIIAASTGIANAIMTRIERGVTSLDGNGMYSGQERKILFCVVAPKEIVKIREIVREFDPGAFVIVSDVREVFGEGFIEY